MWNLHPGTSSVSEQKNGGTVSSVQSTEPEKSDRAIISLNPTWIFV